MKTNVLLTGASGNLGRAALEKFLKEGRQIIALVSPGKGLGYEKPNGVATYEVDLTNDQSVMNVIEQVYSEHHRVDHAILTVGAFATGSVEQTDRTMIEKMISANFMTAYHVARALFTKMVEQKFGRIILVGARPALLAQEGKNEVAYALSKSLIFKLAEILNASASGLNVVTSVVVPGTIDTPANRKTNPAADFTTWVTLDEITDTLQFLLSENGSAVREPVLKLYSNG